MLQTFSDLKQSWLFSFGFGSRPQTQNTHRLIGTFFLFRQYNPHKPAKYGILFKSVNGATIPYTFASDVYAGKPKGEPSEHYVKGTTNTVKKVLGKLAGLQELQGRHLTFDRLYTTVELEQWLLDDMKMTSLGTLMKNKKVFCCYTTFCCLLP